MRTIDTYVLEDYEGTMRRSRDHMDFVSLVEREQNFFGEAVHEVEREYMPAQDILRLRVRVISERAPDERFIRSLSPQMRHYGFHLHQSENPVVQAMIDIQRLDTNATMDQICDLFRRPSMLDFASVADDDQMVMRSYVATKAFQTMLQPNRTFRMDLGPISRVDRLPDPEPMSHVDPTNRTVYLPHDTMIHAFSSDRLSFNGLAGTVVYLAQTYGTMSVIDNGLRLIQSESDRATPAIPAPLRAQMQQAIGRIGRAGSSAVMPTPPKKKPLKPLDVGHKAPAHPVRKKRKPG